MEEELTRKVIIEKNKIRRYDTIEELHNSKIYTDSSLDVREFYDYMLICDTFWYYLYSEIDLLTQFKERLKKNDRLYSIQHESIS